MDKPSRVKIHLCPLLSKADKPGVPDKPEIPDNGTFVGSRRSLMVAAHNGPGGTQMDVFEAEHCEVLPRASWSRRGFLVTTLATGFAVAAGPISAETITTDTIGLDVAEVKVTN